MNTLREITRSPIVRIWLIAAVIVGVGKALQSCGVLPQCDVRDIKSKELTNE